MKMDLHIHTRFSRTRRWGSSSLIEPRQLLDIAAGLRLDGVAVTDHDEIEGSLLVAEMAPAWGILAIPAVEVSAAGGHILALGVTEMIPAGLPAEETVAIIHALGGIASAAHPLNVLVSLRKSDLITLPLDAIETHNPRSPRNRKARALCRKLRRAQTGGSDAHAVEQVGTGITEIPGKFEDYRQVIGAIREGKSVAHGTRAPYSKLARACFATVARQKKEQLTRSIRIALGLPAA